MKSTSKFILLLLTLLTVSCSSYEDTFSLQKSIFIADSENPGLPIYSEWGYNSFGAYIDRQVFTSDNSNLPTKIIVNHDTLHLLLKGVMNGRFASLKFSFVGYPIADYINLTTLNDKTINLKSDSCKVLLTRENVAEDIKIIEGTFTFKRIQNLYVDKEYTKAIVSGVFNLKMFFNNEPTAISSGRFDLGIGYENFYNF
ncbi:MAG: hypothetical protein AUK44_09740 [Porphyromonadaceae bacterium CG2_30_38_12]|nr:MAG: hypothetical protein AUK44_09740 [Porphyromonadaceae bacterium CG2_30_38_12]